MKIKRIILIYTAWNILIYLCVAFYNLSLNPVNFGEGGRFSFVFLGVFVGILAALITDFSDGNKQNE
jgi:hypothetical protein